MMRASILRPPRWHSLAKMGVGSVLGLILSVIPISVFALLTVALLTLSLVRVCVNRRFDAGLILPACIAVIICFLLPVKQLDVRVGPMAYEGLSLSELCDRLYSEYGIICHVLDESGSPRRLSFSTDQPLSRRSVLEKLSRDTNRPLRIGYCLTNATILFGASPSFTYLGEERGARKEPSSSGGVSRTSDIRHE
jgi:hypothetical protein